MTSAVIVANPIAQGWWETCIRGEGTSIFIATEEMEQLRPLVHSYVQTSYTYLLLNM